MLIATDEGLGNDVAEEDDGNETDDGQDEEEPTEAASKSTSKKESAEPKKKKKSSKAEQEASEEKQLASKSALTKSSASKEATRPRFGQRRKPEADQQYSITRGVDLHGVSTVLNADVPTTIRDYVHRVGRCARGGASGTALTLCTFEEEPLLEKIIRAQASKGGIGDLQPLPMQISDAERFRYRVEDMARGLTKKAVAEYRARELQLEALHSEKLKAFFEEHPEDKLVLQRTQRQLRQRKSIREHLKAVPSYLVPENFVAATPVQQAVRQAASAEDVSGSTKRRRIIHARTQDPLQSFSAAPGGGKRARFTRETMLAKERRINPATANIEALPPLSGKKIWKLQHGKRVRKPMDAMGERRRLPIGVRKRQKKFGRR